MSVVAFAAILVVTILGVVLHLADVAEVRNQKPAPVSVEEVEK